MINHQFTLRYHSQVTIMIKFSTIKSYYVKYLKFISLRSKTLELNKDSFVFKNKKKLGRRTAFASLSQEKDLYTHVKSIKSLRRFAYDIPSPGPELYKESVLKAKQRYETNTPISKEINIHNLILATLRVIKYINPNDIKLSPTDIDTATNSLITASSSGFPDYKRQGDIIDSLRSTAKHNWLYQIKSYYNNPLSVAFRLQLRQDVNKINVKVRSIYMNVSLIKIDELRFFLPLYNLIKKSSFYSSGQTGGQLSSSLKSAFFRKEYSNFRLTSTDFSSYDQNAQNEIICLAFAAIRSCFKLTKTQAILFEHILTYFCTSYVTVNLRSTGRLFYVKKKGIPSGSTFTNLVGTLVHAIMLEYIFPNSLKNAKICSDDNIFLSSKLNMSHYDKCMLLFNMKTKVEHYNSAQKFFYLGFNWINFKRNISPLLAINQIIYHSEFRVDLSTYDRCVSRTASVLLNGINGPDYFKLLFPALYEHIMQGNDFKFFYFNNAKPRFVEVPASFCSLKHHLTNGWSLR